MAQLLRKIKRAILNYDPSFCDMHDDEHARAAAEEYLAHIRRHLRERFGDQTVSILDAGCQAGRLLIPLAQDGHHLIGVDTSGFALRRTRQHAQERRLSVRLHTGGIAKLRRWVRPSSLDAVICTEVLYLCADYHNLLQLLAESVKPGGLLFISHRPTVFYVASALRQGRADQAASVLRRTEGPSPDGEYHNWQTQEQLAELYRSLNLTLLGCYPVDHARVPLDLSTVTEAEVKRLLEPAYESDSTFRIPAYLLVVAQKG